MWDIGGQEKMRQVWSTYWENTQAIILVIDSADKLRMHIVKQELDRIIESEDLKNACILVYWYWTRLTHSNKQDIPGALGAASINEELNLDSFKTREWKIQACSAFTGHGLHEGLDWIVDRLVKP